MISYKYIIAYINRFFKNGDVLYTAPSYNEIFEEFNHLCDYVVNENDLCIYNIYEKQITKAYKDGLYSIYNKNGTLLAICEEEFLLSNELRPSYRIYDFIGNDVTKLIFRKKKDLNKARAEEALNKTKREKNKFSFNIKLDNFDNLSELEQVKCLELSLITLREKFPSTKINIGERYENVRYTVRRSFEDREKNYYTDLETAKLSCPVGYSVFDVLTGKCVYIKEKSIDDLKKESEEGMKYKEAWNKLKEFLEDRKDMYLACADILYVETYQTALNAMKDFEGEMLKK